MVYIDGPFAPKNIKMKHKTFIKGDEKITCIAAASIVDKVTRDLFMIKLAKKYPEYFWNKNFGYGTTDHLRGLKKYGITKHHRKKFKPVHKMLINKTRETQQKSFFFNHYLTDLLIQRLIQRKVEFRYD